jgi:hypothetical protein
MYWIWLGFKHVETAKGQNTQPTGSIRDAIEACMVNDHVNPHRSGFSPGFRWSPWVHLPRSGQ